MDSQQAVLILVIVVGLAVLIFFLIFMRLFGLWLSAQLAGVRISLLQMILMRWRRVDPRAIVDNMVTAHKAGIPLTRDQLEAHFLAGGNIKRVVNALVSADKANIPLDFKAATAIDLAGRDVFEAVQLSVNPKVIESPPVTAPATTEPEKKKGMSNTAKGAIIGGVGGAVVGATVGKNAKGAIIGGVVGAAAGTIIGRSKDKKKAAADSTKN